MNKDQAEQVEDLVQQIAKDSGISFDAAFKVAIGILKLHGINTHKGAARAGGSAVKDEWRYCQHGDPDKAEPMR